MSVITVFAGTFCNEESILEALKKSTGYALIEDNELIARASKLSGLSEDRIGRSFSTRGSVFNKFTHEMERSVAHLKLVMAQILSQDGLLISGFATQLVPQNIQHVLRICLIADLKSRKSTAAAGLGVPQQDAAKLIHKQDEDRAHWTKRVNGSTDPWASDLYDMILPTDKMSAETIAETIASSADTSVVRRGSGEHGRRN